MLQPTHLTDENTGATSGSGKRVLSVNLGTPTSVMLVSAVLLPHGLGSAFPVCSIPASLPCPGSPCPVRVPSSYSSLLFGSSMEAAESKGNWTSADKGEGRSWKEEEGKGCRPVKIVL